MSILCIFVIVHFVKKLRKLTKIISIFNRNLYLQRYDGIIHDTNSNGRDNEPKVIIADVNNYIVSSNITAHILRLC